MSSLNAKLLEVEEVEEAASASILTEAMKIEKELEAAEAFLSSSKQELINHLKNYSVLLKSGGASLNGVAEAADNVVNSLSFPDSNNDFEHVLSIFESMSSLLPSMAGQLSQKCEDLNSRNLSFIAQYKVKRGQFLDLTSNFENCLDQLEEDYPTDEDGKSFMESYRRFPPPSLTDRIYMYHF